ncbi:peptide chain release factor aRF-1 [Candidatus Woesearchaeota archaeon]|nr:peptide chain release factor aRF-1 [Candidatus Woesearchaeota archaeon]
MARLTEQQRYKLKHFIKAIENFRGRHTELVTVYIPAGYEITKIIGHLVQEQGTASNIKSSTTRNNVINALERMVQHLRLFKQTPPHGLAVFSGNVAEREGQQDYKVWSIEPPVPLNTRLYRCDKQFQLDLLRDMLDVKEAYGLVVMDRREADIALLKGKTIVSLTSAKSNVPGKTRAGGQSSVRFSRLREDAAKEFYGKIGMMMKDQFLFMEGLKGIIVGGPGPTKYEFVDGDFITNEVKKKIIAIKDLSYTGEFGLQELVDKSQDVLAQEELADEKKIMNRFFELLATKPRMASYGLEEVKKNVLLGVVDTLLLSETLDENIIDELEQEAEKMGTTVKLISQDTREGAQLRDIGKIAAILRYEVEQQ